VLSFIGVLILLYLQFKGSEKIAYVDNNKILTGYKEIIKLKDQLDKKEKNIKANVDTLALELENSIKEYERQRSSMTERERKTKEELLNHKKNQYEEYRSVVGNKLKEESSKDYAPVFKKINDCIKEFGQKHNYKIILGATEYGNLVYADDKIDLTDEILKWLNSEK